MSWWSYAPMSTRFNYYMPIYLCSVMLICLDTLMTTCSHARMLLCSHVFTCLVEYVEDRILPCSLLDAHFIDCLHAWMFTCLNAYTLTCFGDLMLLISHSFLIICYYAACFEDNMLPCTHTLIFTCLISTHAHTLGWWYVSMFSGLSDCEVAHLYP